MAEVVNNNPIINQVEQQQNQINNQNNNSSVSSAPQKKINSNISMWDTFEHIIMFISMYVVAISIGMFSHYNVDKYSPSFTEDIFSYFSIYNTGNEILLLIASALIVAYPIFAILFLHITKKSIKSPELLNLKSRKILIYITLTFTFLYMLLKLIILIFGSLLGNFSINFLLHFLVTIGISGLIFVYYLYLVRKEHTND